MRIVWRLPDGSIAVTVPAAPMLEGESEAGYLDRIAAHAQLVGPELAAAVRVADIPDQAHVTADRTFRGAWAWTSGAPEIDIDMPKARVIHQDHLRALRAPLLAASDVEFIRAIEQRDLPRQAQIAARKQALRDVTTDPAIAAARTIEELKAAIPAALRG